MKRYTIVEQDGYYPADFARFVSGWLEGHTNWEPVGAPFRLDNRWCQAMFYRRPEYDA